MYFSDNPEEVRLSDFGLRIRARFLYEYDFGDSWEHQIRVKKILTPKSNCFYPVCIDGKRACTPFILWWSVRIYGTKARNT
ncbi:hypothetical protein IQ247_10060 [Plectonema cf. radiosum LEGE 06105]|uniref:Plasmid pRiA4b Orf3-like domain-containing protein n=1 Tax=Plectonema cf. radiosum LEGE 06105 TaxID=945769 RepID=A0A8J7F313_9CYAN|nr:hypothetical protein [Plectonema cf. radiosum LEGE 06105]